jgi:hypothetical protein
VATNNYLVNGGSGGRVFADGREIRDTMTPVRDALIKDIKAHSTIHPPAGGRFVRTDLP